MGKSAPTPPAPPDPSQVIGDQANADQNSALLQSKLNNVNYSGPQGNVSYNLDPSSQWTENVQLNPTSAATYASTNADQLHASQLAGQQLDAVGHALGQGLNVPGMQTSAPVGNLQSSYGQGGQLAYGYNPGGAIQGQVAPTYSPFSSLATNPYGTGASGGGGGQAQSQSQNAAQAFSPSNPPPGMKYDQSSGLIPDQQYGVDSTGAHPGEMYAGNGQWAPADNRAIYPQSSPGAAPQGAQSQPYQTNPGNPQLSQAAQLLSNPVAGTQAATYAQARQMLDPQWQQASEHQQAQLVAQGLNPNDAAYQNSQTLFGNQENAAYNSALYSAINAGDAEQNTLYGQNLQSGQFANASQLQGNQENQQAAGFNNTTAGQANAQNAGAAAFNNTAAGQNYLEQLAIAQLANQAGQQTFQNQAYTQQLPIDEFTALMNGSQVAQPPSAPAQNTQVGVPDVTGAYGLQAQSKQAAYQAQMQNYSSGLGGLFNLGSAGIMGSALYFSDRRLKRDVTKIGERPDGIGVYVFRYLAHHAWHVGVMAQEVQKIRPDAVFTQDGWLGVNYERLAA